MKLNAAPVPTMTAYCASDGARTPRWSRNPIPIGVPLSARLPSCRPSDRSAASAEAFILAGVAVGIGFATAQPALQALAIDLAEPAERGAAMATFWAFTDFGVITGSFVSGQIVSVSGFGTVFVVSAVMPLVGVAGLLTWRQLRRPAAVAI